MVQGGCVRRPIRVVDLAPPRWTREQGEAEDDAAAGLSSPSRSMSGYQRLQMAPTSPSRVFTRDGSNTCAPRLDHCICGFVQKRHSIYCNL